MHLYDETRFPLAPTATFKPPHAPLAAYREVQRALGLERVVFVQPTGYGFDNRCILDALAQTGASSRAVVIVAPDVLDAELSRLHQAGVRGVRFMMIPGAGGPLAWDSIEAMAERLLPLGWHINLQLDGRDLPARKALIDRLPCPVVIDHTGKFLVPVPVADPAFQALLSILQQPKRYVKIAAPYETSKIGPPGFDDVAALAQALLRAFPDRCLWASNWPHPNTQPLPDSADMLALLSQWAPDEATRQRVLVDNPARLYGF